MADAQNPIPSPQSGDSEDVELALETSQRLYKTGDHAEALKWLRRAANSAEEAGDDMRQLQLARVAADLTAAIHAGPQVLTSAPSVIPPAKASVVPAGTQSRLPQPPSKQPPQPPAPSTRGSVAPSAAPSALPKPVAAAAASALTSLTPQPPSASGGPPPLPSGKARPAPPSTSASAAAAATAARSASPESQIPPARSSDSQAPPPRASDSQMPVAPKPVALSIKPKPIEPLTSAISTAKPQSLSAVSTQIKPEKPNTASLPSGIMDVGRGAMRVSVRVSARDENLLIVRPLAQGQRLPVGAREARLVFEQDAALPLNQSHGE